MADLDDVFVILRDPKNPERAIAAVPMLLWCPVCHERHIDEGEFATKPHRDHSCQHCGLTWRPAKICTIGVRFLPGYENEREAHGEDSEQVWTAVRAALDEVWGPNELVDINVEQPSDYALVVRELIGLAKQRVVEPKCDKCGKRYDDEPARVAVAIDASDNEEKLMCDECIEAQGGDGFVYRNEADPS